MHRPYGSSVADNNTGNLSMTSELHHRSHEQLMQYWNTLRGGHDFPQESDVDPDAIAEIWPSCFLISIDDVTRKVGYRYSYLGDQLIEAYGDDVTNPDVALTSISTSSIPIVQKLDEVLKTKKPVFDESDFINLKGLHVKYRTCMLPLGFDDGQISHIMGCMRWRLY
jgi:hypothetical protein